MSKYIDEIIKDIRTNPETWKRYGNNGLQKGSVQIQECGNGSMWLFFYGTSIADVVVNGKHTWHALTWRDKCRIEQTFLWWMENASVKMLQVL